MDGGRSVMPDTSGTAGGPSPPQIFVISLPDAEHRRKSLVDELHKLGFIVRLHEAIDGRTRLPEEKEAMLDRDLAIRRTGRALTDAEFACTLSHISVFQTMIAEEIHDAVVLEDDAILKSGFDDVVRSPMPDWADLILFDHRNCFVRRIGRRRRLSGLSACRIAYRTPTLATGYRINIGSARRMIEKSLPIHQVIDWPEYVLYFRTFALTPRIVDHSDPNTGHSYIRQQRAESLSEHPSRETRTRKHRRFFSPRYWKRKIKYTRIS